MERGLDATCATGLLPTPYRPMRGCPLTGQGRRVVPNRSAQEWSPSGLGHGYAALGGAGGGGPAPREDIIEA